MTNHTVDEHLVGLEIRIFASDERAAGYPVEITLGGQQEFPRGHLSAGILPWEALHEVASPGYLWAQR